MTKRDPRLNRCSEPAERVKTELVEMPQAAAGGEVHSRRLTTRRLCPAVRVPRGPARYLAALRWPRRMPAFDWREALRPVVVVAALGVGVAIAGAISLRTSAPDGAPERQDLARMYPYGIGGGTAADGTRAPPVAYVTFAYDGRTSCGRHHANQECLQYRFAAVGSRDDFAGSMVVRHDTDGWRLASYLGPGMRLAAAPEGDSLGLMGE